MPALQASYDVGGIAYPRPFKIRRLGHFGFNVADMQGASISIPSCSASASPTTLDIGKIPGPRKWPRCEDRAYLHDPQFRSSRLPSGAQGARRVLRRRRGPQGRHGQPDHLAGRHARRGRRRRRLFQRAAGRDPPHRPRHAGQQLALLFPRSRRPHRRALLRHGADRLGRPLASRDVYYRGFHEQPSCRRSPRSRRSRRASPRASTSSPAMRIDDAATRSTIVGGVMLPRPFKITNIGPMRLFVDGCRRVEAFYTETHGLRRDRGGRPTRAIAASSCATAASITA